METKKLNGFQYFLLAFKKYAVFKGRSTRSEFWYFYLAYIIIAIILSILSSFAKSLDVLVILFGIVSIIPILAISVRRMHDIGKSGWNYLWNLLPIIGNIYFIVLLCTKSQEGDNKYGPNPWGQAAAATPVTPSPEMPQTPVQ